MRCLAAACALLLTVGCATEDARRQWNEAMKDARGENMEMRNNFATPAKKTEKSSLPDQ